MILRRRGFMAKTPLFLFSVKIFHSLSRGSNSAKFSGFKQKSYTVPKLGVNKFNSGHFTKSTRIFGLRRCEIEFWIEWYRWEILQRRDFGKESIKCPNFLKKCIFHVAYAKSRDFFLILKDAILFRIQFCNCRAENTYSVIVRRYEPAWLWSRPKSGGPLIPVQKTILWNIWRYMT